MLGIVILLYMCTLLYTYTYDELFLLHCTATWHHPGIGRGLESEFILNGVLSLISAFVRAWSLVPFNFSGNVTALFKLHQDGSDKVIGWNTHHTNMSCPRKEKPPQRSYPKFWNPRTTFENTPLFHS
jgi:hypothetical protein